MTSFLLSKRSRIRNYEKVGKENNRPWDADCSEVFEETCSEVFEGVGCSEDLEETSSVGEGPFDWSSEKCDDVEVSSSESETSLTSVTMSSNSISLSESCDLFSLGTL